MEMTDKSRINYMELNGLMRKIYNFMSFSLQHCLFSLEGECWFLFAGSFLHGTGMTMFK